MRIDELALQRRATALVSFTRVAGVSAWQFRRSVLEQLPVSGHGLEPGVPRRQLEQHGRELPVGEPQQELAVEPEQRGLPAGRSSAQAVDAAWD